MIQENFDHIVVSLNASQVQGCTAIFVCLFCICSSLTSFENVLNDQKYDFFFTNCLSFDWWIFDLVTFKNYKEKLTCTSRIVAISVLLFKAATWRAVLLLFESGSSVNSGHFAVTLFAALEKQRIYSDVMVKTLSKTLFSMAQHFFYDF